ncbi:MAG: alpha/beta hydrolase, partial [Lachnospiraceae bacterium]|nr:alpha/beta hydrolase [Lachnospiraceae bacterium]
MGLITEIYKKRYLRRFDKDDAIPYYSASDFPGLINEQNEFRNRDGVPVRYFTYRYETYDPEKLILFCPGIGPGHTAYFAEIEALCRAGFRVLTLDYTGCGASGGKRLPSINAPAKDASELLALLHPEEEIIPVGHSLGGYTALNLAHLLPEVTRAVILSGFISIADEMAGVIKSRFLVGRVKRYEEKLNPDFASLDNLAYLKTTTDRLLWIHSSDDPIVNYPLNAGKALEAGNPNVRVITAEGKKHNPQYTSEALAAMNAWIGGYSRLVKEKKLRTPEERKAYFADKPVDRMTDLDPAVMD